ncbi:hypothetical protein BDN71DRAFT_610488 [Pleurotus eryngii]|uniref:Uncharacterized protein n=1 Tax=Pleurotus eryngii TaxID=5323 RepID=A0A9P5ZZZ6_PLEER|nr:hypothetical protein BDN71DRAFT_610488 [Pleurotus eryngii]
MMMRITASLPPLRIANTPASSPNLPFIRSPVPHVHSLASPHTEIGIISHARQVHYTHRETLVLAFSETCQNAKRTNLSRGRLAFSVLSRGLERAITGCAHPYIYRIVAQTPGIAKSPQNPILATGRTYQNTTGSFPGSSQAERYRHTLSRLLHINLRPHRSASYCPRIYRVMPGFSAGIQLRLHPSCWTLMHLLLCHSSRCPLSVPCRPPADGRPLASSEVGTMACSNLACK